MQEGESLGSSGECKTMGSLQILTVGKSFNNLKNHYGSQNRTNENQKAGLQTKFSRFVPYGLWLPEKSLKDEASIKGNGHLLLFIFIMKIDLPQIPQL